MSFGQAPLRVLKRRAALFCLCLVLLGSTVWAEPYPQKRVTLTYRDVNLVSVLDALAREMDVYCYIAPTVRGAVTIDVQEIPADDAVLRVLASQSTEYSFVLLDDVPVKGTVTLVVATPDEMPDLIRGSSEGAQASAITLQEYQLEEAPAGRVLNFLRTLFPNVEFTPHPIMNGFYARGSVKNYFL